MVGMEKKHRLTSSAAQNSFQDVAKVEKCAPLQDFYEMVSKGEGERAAEEAHD
jgi:hypothetical protein